MTFEEAREQLSKLFSDPNVPGYSIGDFDPEFIGSVGDLEEIFDKLQETYAPKIKMTSYQCHIFENCKVAKMEFSEFSKSKTYDKIPLELLSIAWLHPELIEVSDEKG